MHNRGQYHVGVLLIVIGAIFLIARIFDVSVWGIIWPLGLIGVGVWLLFRHRHIDSDTTVNQKFLGDIQRQGAWQVTNEEIRVFIGDIDLDMTQADIPTGETRINVFGFIGDVDILVPKSVGISVASSGFITDAKIMGQKEDKFLGSINKASDNYQKAKQKIKLETTYFINDITVKQV